MICSCRVNYPDNSIRSNGRIKRKQEQEQYITKSTYAVLPSAWLLTAYGSSPEVWRGAGGAAAGGAACTPPDLGEPSQAASNPEELPQKYS